MVKIPLLLQWGCIYNNEEVMLHLPYDSLHTLMTIQLLMTFQLYMTLHIPYMSFGLPLYNTFLKHNLHHWPQWCGMWQLMTWHDMKLLTWIGWWCGSVTSVWPGDKESSVILSLELRSQIDVPLLCCDWSPCMFNYKSVFQHDSPLHIFFHHLMITW